MRQERSIRAILSDGYMCGIRLLLLNYRSSSLAAIYALKSVSMYTDLVQLDPMPTRALVVDVSKAAGAGAGSLIRENNAQGIHESVRVFFIGGNGVNIGSKSFKEPLLNGHLFIIDVCLHYLHITKRHAQVKERTQSGQDKPHESAKKDLISNIGSIKFSSHGL